jgi:hypothetical protein
MEGFQKTWAGIECFHIRTDDNIEKIHIRSDTQV